MADRILKLNDLELNSIFSANPDFDILNFDFYNNDTVKGLNLENSAEQMEKLKAYQRLLRIYPDEEIAKKLMDKQLDSACKIANLPEYYFIEEYKDVFNGNSDLAAEYHKNAVHINQSTLHQFGIVKDLVASPHYRATTVCNIHESVSNHYENLPSYKSLFGDLDYLECDYSESVFSPAAYFLDIMKIVDDYITQPNVYPVRRIPAGYKFEERRPDLFNVELTSNNTNDIIPYIDVINKVLEKNIESIAKIENAPKFIGLSKYPFNSPYNLPLQKIRLSLNKIGVSLSDIYNDFKNPNQVNFLDIAREELGLSVEQLSIYTKSDSSLENLNDIYGFKINIQDPGILGLGIIGFMKDQSVVTGVNTSFTNEISVGDSIIVNGITNKVVNIESDTKLSVLNNWAVNVGSEYFAVSDVEQSTQGPGTVSYDPADGIVVGEGTCFTKDFKIGDKIKVANMTKKVTQIQSDVKLLVDTPWPGVILPMNYTIISMTEIKTKGKGIAIIPQNTKRTYGQNSKFTTEFKAGQKIELNGIGNQVKEIVSDDEMIMLSTWDNTSGSEYSIWLQSKKTNIEDYLPKKGNGTLAINSGEIKVTGTNTNFKSQINIGDEIKVNGEIRTVISIASDNELSVKSKFTKSISNVEYYILVKDGLDIVDKFIARTDVKRDDLIYLFNQNLSKKELDADIANRFFINNTSEGHPMKIVLSDNPDNLVQRIEGLSLQRLDRINRFVRLSTATHFNFEELDQAIYATNAREITEEFIINLAKINTIKNITQFSINQVTAFISEMRIIGRVDDAFPQSFFDTIFNNSILLNGTDPYEDGSKLPFNPIRTPIQSWTIASSDVIDGIIRSRLRAALMINDSDLTKLAHYIVKLVEGKDDNIIELSLTNLTLFYRITTLSDYFGLTLDEYLMLLYLKYYPDSKNNLEPGNGEKPEKPIIPETADALLEIIDTVNWVKESDFDIYQLSYICSEKSSEDGYKPDYTDEDIISLINKMAKISEEVKLSENSIKAIGLDDKQANCIVKKLVDHRVINDKGIFIDLDINYQDVSYLMPVYQKDDKYVCGFEEDTFNKLIASIDLEQSVTIYKTLKTMNPPVLETLKDGTVALVDGFDEATNISDALATALGIGKEDPIIVNTKDFLLVTKEGIKNIRNQLINIKNVQKDKLERELSSVLGTSQNTIASLFATTLVQSKLNNYLTAFYSPLTDLSTLPEDISNFVRIISKWSLIIDKYKFTSKEVLFITSDGGAWHLSIKNLNKLNISDIKALSDYKEFDKDLVVSNNSLIDYFNTDKALDSKIKVLCNITGWDIKQIEILIKYFWPIDKAEEDYDTIFGLEKLKRCFEMGNLLGTEMSFLLKLCTISHLSLAQAGKETENWNVYEDMAYACFGLLGAKYEDVIFTQINKEICDELSTEYRDALLRYALFLNNYKNPDITSFSDLYEFLLIDVEMSSAANTSLIAQGIASVQFYMQRCRMMLERGVSEIKIPKIWWTWISEYRLWEVNRKIFLYPENYIDPNLRKDSTKNFKNLSESLLQNDITKENVEKSFMKYFEEVSVLANLVYVSSYNCRRVDTDTGEEMETLFLFGRTNTQPYIYYYRTLDDGESWSSWQEIKLSIPANTVSPVYAFDRLFIFWTEIDTGKSSTLNDNTLNYNTVNKGSIKYSFLFHNNWVTPQVLKKDIIINAYPIEYKDVKDNIAELIDINNQFWNTPYAISTGKGFVGAGKISFTKASQIVKGEHTRFNREIKPGDSIQCLGEIQVVESVNSANELVVTNPWEHQTTSANFKIFTCDDSNRIEAFEGKGLIVITKDLMLVSGINTNFLDEVSIGDEIKCGNESHQVAKIVDNTNLLVTSAWTSSYDHQKYLVIPKLNGDEQILVLYGAIAETSKIKNFSKPNEINNPEKDTFKDQQNEFNKSIFNASRIAKDSYLDSSNYVTVTSGFLLDKNLAISDGILLITDYKNTSAENPRPYKSYLNRSQSSLQIEASNNCIQDNYWGNDLSGFNNPLAEASNENTVNILKYISEKKSSLLNVINQPGWFIFNNSDEAFLIKPQNLNLNKLSDVFFIQQKPFPGMPNNVVLGTSAISEDAISIDSLKFDFIRLTTNTISTLTQRLFAGGIDNLLTIESQQVPELQFKRFYPDLSDTPPSYIIPPASETMDFSGSFGDYFWEIFFHTPFLIAQKLNENKRFDDAKAWYQYIFNPTQQVNNNDKCSSEDRFWRFLPFRSMEIQSIAEILADKKQIKKYNYDPFNPHIIASYRHVAYAKTIVMQYIENLLDWGDSLYSQNTQETINQAANLYLLAKDLLGDRPHTKGKAPDLVPKCFNDLKAEEQKGEKSNKLQSFLVELENSKECYWNSDDIRYVNIPLININTYFYITENKDFIKYWDRIEDRFFKIRHCMNIDGVVQQLPLFSPAIDPMALVRAVAGGGSAMSFAAQLSRNIPFYKYEYLLEKTRMFVNQLSSLGSALLSALEKKDIEKLNLIKSQQEKTILNFTTIIKEKEIEDAVTTANSLNESLNSASYRKNYYAKLQKDGISDKEYLNIGAMTAAMIFNQLGIVSKTAASIGYSVPQVGSPFAMTYGGAQIGNALNAASGVFDIGSSISTFISQLSLTMAGYERRDAEWNFQEKIAEFDMKQIQQQINSNTIKKAIAEQVLRIHQENIKQNEENELFYKDKFTNEELYQWLIARLSNIYFQTYSLAYDMALATQTAFQYEFNTNKSFISFECWDSLHKGLGAAEALMFNLNQMEKFTIETNSRGFEIDKTISLLQVNPVALLDLKANGECIFELTEKLFDSDFPGHYNRKIKSISISIPAVVGPYQSINATLVQMSNKTIISCDDNGAKAVNFLMGGKGAKTPGSDVLRTNCWINQQIAISKAVNDSGVFELNFNDNRYLPFEGTGAVSSWKLSMPKSTNCINFNSISDIIISIKYTANDGGEAFRSKIVDFDAFKKRSGATFISLNQKYSSEWNNIYHAPAIDNTITMEFSLQNFIPANINGARISGFYFKMYSSEDVPNGCMTLEIAKGEAVAVNLSSKNDFYHHFDKPISINEVLKNNNKISFLLKTPEGKTIDINTVKNIQLIYYYDGEVRTI